MTVLAERDAENGRTWAMWAEAGLQFRANIVERAGGQVPLHAHGYDHVAIITHGWFDCIIDGGAPVQVASKDFRSDDPDFRPTGYRVFVGKGQQHTFILRECHDQPGEVLCIFPDKE